MNQQSVLVRLYDKNGDKIDELQMKSNVTWEWNRKGGCGQCQVTFPTTDDSYIHDYLRPGANVEIYTKLDGVETLRYAGKLIRPTRSVQNNQEVIVGTFYGYLIELSGQTVVRNYIGSGIKTIMQDVLDQDVSPNTSITYLDADIDDPGYSIESISLNHLTQDAMSLLVSLAGNYEWGVDQNKRFFFKATDPNVKHIFILGQDVINYTEERQDDQIVNQLDLYGANDVSTTITCDMSVSIYGLKKASPIYDHSILGLSDLNRLGVSILKKASGAIHSVKFNIIKADVFIEQTLPIGAAAVNRQQFRNRPKYGTSHKYGTKIRYGNIKRDQFENIVYEIRSGAILATATLINDIPNISDLQKRFEFEIKELQRR